ncbi:MAG TPA: hypothetical protein VEL12_17835 [Candidatus Nitrosopolaris sp.]|nr:hypothetical protein [Candidatus Nitrosopolaris sp.]
MIDVGKVEALSTGYTRTIPSSAAEPADHLTGSNARKRKTIVALSERLSERINRTMGELIELGAVRPRLLADDTIELRPWPASPELSHRVSEIFERAGVKELRPWVWGVAKADDVSRRRSSRAVAMRTVAALALIGTLVGAFVGILKFRRARLSG